MSKVRRKRSPGRNGYASPTSRSAPVAFGVKIATYSSGSARKNSSTASRERSTSSVIADEVGLTEWGLPKTLRPQQLEVLRELRLGVEAGAGVVEVDVSRGVEPREVGGAELVQRCEVGCRE